MEKRAVIRKFLPVLFGLLVSLGLYLTSRYNYPLFHSFADMFSAVIAITAFLVVWNGRHQLDNHYFLYVGISFLFFAFLDFMHLLGNKNMGVFPQYGNLGPPFYIASRYVLSISMLLAPLFIKRKLHITSMFVVYSLVTIFILLSIFYWKIFPVTFVEGVGLTTFKVVSDYIICLILLGAIGLLLINRRFFDSKILRLIVSSIALSIATGLAFTLYTDPFGVMNAVGHFLQIASFWLAYLALIETCLTKPQAVVFRNLKQSEEALKKYRDHLEELVAERTAELRTTNVNLLKEVSEHTKTEEQLNHTYGILLTIRNINQLITQVNNEPELLQKACEILVDGRNYKIAWIGTTSEGSYDVLQVAQAGFEDGYLSSVKITWDNSEYGQGPTGMAIKTKRPSIIRDTANDERYRPWREQALKRGYASSAALPLIVENRVIGALNIYSEKRDAFDDAEMNMLMELAGDICLGIQKIRQGEALRQSEKLFSDAFHIGPVGMTITRIADGKFIDANESFCKMFEFNPTEVIGHTSAELNMWSPQERAILIERQRESGGLRNYELTALSKSGKVVNIFFSSTMLTIEGQACLLTTMVDITERKQAEEALKVTEERFHKAFHSNPTPAVITNIATALIIDANESYARTFGFSRAEVLGKSPIELNILRDPAQREEVVRQLREQGSAHDYEITLFDKSGEAKQMVASTEAIELVGQPCMLSVFFDLTEIKKAEEYRRKTQEQLMVQDRLASIGQLASGIAHEMNNPLTGVIGFSEMLMQRTDLPDDAKEDLKVVNDEAKRTANVVKGLLTFARKQKTEKEPVDINNIIQSVLQLRSYEHRVSNIEVNARLAPELPAVLGNSGQLQQIFINLMVNAEQAMLEAHNRGTLTIITERVGDTVKASVADDGPGISKENMGRLFTPFFTTKEVGKGTGLGLSICHGIVTEHSGNIHAESEPGKGATFVVELPINK